ncbi:hypothetical protein ACHAXN_013075 [Cyclotella atomus]
MSNQINQVDELLKGLKKVPGFKSYLVLNSDGIVIRWEQVDGQMTYNSAVQHAHHIISLYNKSVASMRELDPEDGQLENVRVRTGKYEMIISSMGSYTLAVFQEDSKKKKSEDA